ncbi:hypothetical protein B0H13DRAFT_1872096 [Mycena leptocephala]|nr:hypothetical protein B0H13DRAFT_1872096 [Mycena leptocephala]
MEKHFAKVPVNGERKELQECRAGLPNNGEIKHQTKKKKKKRYLKKGLVRRAHSEEIACTMWLIPEYGPCVRVKCAPALSPPACEPNCTRTAYTRSHKGQKVKGMGVVVHIVERSQGPTEPSSHRNGMRSAEVGWTIAGKLEEEPKRTAVPAQTVDGSERREKASPALEFEKKNFTECKSQGYTRSAERHNEEDVKTSAKMNASWRHGTYGGRCLPGEICGTKERRRKLALGLRSGEGGMEAVTTAGQIQTDTDGPTALQFARGRAGILRCWMLNFKQGRSLEQQGEHESGWKIDVELNANRKGQGIGKQDMTLRHEGTKERGTYTRGMDVSESQIRCLEPVPPILRFGQQVAVAIWNWPGI